MTNAILTHNAEQLDNRFRAIRRRRILVHTLRWVVPCIGVLLLLALMTPMLIGFIFPTAKFDAIRIAKNQLIIDAPRAKGTLGDGGRYEASAHSAETELLDQDIVTLVDLVGDFFFVDGMKVNATSDDGIYTFSTEILELFSLIDILSSKGDVGKIGNGIADMAAQTFSGKGGVDLDFADGTTLDADTMFYNAEADTWNFTNFTLVMEQVPEGSTE